MKIISKITYSLMLLISILGIVASLFYSKFISWTKPINLTFSVLFVIGLIFILFNLIFIIKHHLHNGNFKNINVIILIFIIIIQLICIYFLKFIPWGDALEVKIQAFDLLHHAHVWPYYFYQHPNNVNITIFLMLLLKFFTFLGITNSSVLNCILTITFSLMMILTIILISKIVKILIGDKWETISLFLLMLMDPFYFYSFNVYTDPVIVFLTVLSMYILVKLILTFNEKNSKKIYLLMLALVILDFAFIIKDNVIFFLISIVMLSLLFLIKPKQRKIAYTILTSLLVILVLSFFSIQDFQKTNHFYRDSFKQETTLSYLYMASDPKTNGMYNHKDVVLFEQIKHKNPHSYHRTQYKLLKKRWRSFNVNQLIKLYVKKFIITFGYSGVNNDFEVKHKGFINLHLNQITFWINNLTQTIYCMLWIGLSIFSFNKVFINNDNELKNYFNLFISWTLIMLFIFHSMIWEAGNRYNFLALPLLILLSLQGLNKLIVNIENKLIYYKGDQHKNNVLMITTIIISSLVLLIGGYRSISLTKIKSNAVWNKFISTRIPMELGDKYCSINKHTEISEKMNIKFPFKSVAVPGNLNYSNHIHVDLITPKHQKIKLNYYGHKLKDNTKNIYNLDANLDKPNGWWGRFFKYSMSKGVYLVTVRNNGSHKTLLTNTVYDRFNVYDKNSIILFNHKTNYHINLEANIFNKQKLISKSVLIYFVLFTIILNLTLLSIIFKK